MVKHVRPFMAVMKCNRHSIMRLVRCHWPINQTVASLTRLPILLKRTRCCRIMILCHRTPTGMRSLANDLPTTTVLTRVTRVWPMYRMRMKTHPSTNPIMTILSTRSNKKKKKKKKQRRKKQKQQQQLRQNVNMKKKWKRRKWKIRRVLRRVAHVIVTHVIAPLYVDDVGTTTLRRNEKTIMIGSIALEVIVTTVITRMDEKMRIISTIPLGMDEIIVIVVILVVGMITITMTEIAMVDVMTEATAVQTDTIVKWLIVRDETTTTLVHRLRLR